MALTVETTAAEVGCPDCGTRVIGHGRGVCRCGTWPVAGRPVVLCWAKRIWRCANPDRVEGDLDRNPPGGRGAGCADRAGRERDPSCRLRGGRVGRQGGLSVRDGVGDGHELRATPPAARRRPRPHRFGDDRRVDETLFTHSTERRPAGFATGIVDLDGGLLLDVVAGRNGRVVAHWLTGRPEAWRLR